MCALGTCIQKVRAFHGTRPPDGTRDLGGWMGGGGAGRSMGQFAHSGFRPVSTRHAPREALKHTSMFAVNYVHRAVPFCAVLGGKSRAKRTFGGGRRGWGGRGRGGCCAPPADPSIVPDTQQNDVTTTNHARSRLVQRIHHFLVVKVRERCLLGDQSGEVVKHGPQCSRHASGTIQAPFVVKQTPQPSRPHTQ